MSKNNFQQGEQILLLEGGRIVEQGSHEELLKSGREYAKMYIMQLGQPRTIKA